MLKLNPVQAKKTDGTPAEKFLGWAETHAHYTTFTHAELVIWIAPGCAVEARLAVLNMLAAHCAALHHLANLDALAVDALAPFVVSFECEFHVLTVARARDTRR